MISSSKSHGTVYVENQQAERLKSHERRPEVKGLMVDRHDGR